MEGCIMLDAIVMDMDGTLLDPNNKILPETKAALIACQKQGTKLVGSLTLAHSQNSQMSFMYGFFFVKFLFFTVVCVVIVV